jgi:fructokinase
VVVDGRLLAGPNAIAGEWGHNPIPWPEHDERPGPDCYCGKQGCIETFVSGPGMAEDHRRQTGDTLAPPEILTRAQAGDGTAQLTLERHLGRLARALASVINLLDPNVIVLGGGLSNLPHLYEDLPRLIRPWLICDGMATPIRPPLHGDSSGVRGAAWLWEAEPAAGAQGPA